MSEEETEEQESEDSGEIIQFGEEEIVIFLRIF